MRSPKRPSEMNYKFIVLLLLKHRLDKIACNIAISENIIDPKSIYRCSNFLRENLTLVATKKPKTNYEFSNPYYAIKFTHAVC